MAVFTGGRGRQVFEGTADSDRMFGFSGSDILRGLGGNDVLEGGADNDTLDGGTGSDRLSGGTGDDRYYIDQAPERVIEDEGAGRDTVFASYDYVLARNVEDLRLSGAARIGTGNALANRITGRSGDDALFGLDGDDVLIGLGGNDRLEGGDGDDILRPGPRLETGGVNTLIGGAGDDIYYLDFPIDTVIEEAGGDYDTVILRTNDNSFFLAANVERLVMQGTARYADGNDLDNLIIGSDGADTIEGGAGNDVIRSGAGSDGLNGGDGDDILFGDGGFGDGFTGGGGADRFVLGPVGGGITDFSRSDGDVIDLHLIDANRRVAGDQAFVFIGTQAFSGVAGELRYDIAQSRLRADINGDAVADITIFLPNTPDLVQQDFIL